jgi:hypothetical protein
MRNDIFEGRMIVTLMNVISLVHPDEQRQVPADQLTTKCELFKNHPDLLTKPFSLKSSIPVSVFREFVSDLQDCPIKITPANVAGLSDLSTEFGFRGLSV